MSILTIGWTFFGTRWGKILAAVLAGFLALNLNNMYQRSKGREQIVQASHKAGIKRNEKSDKIRRSIDPGTAWKRLRQEYAGDR